MNKVWAKKRYREAYKWEKVPLKRFVTRVHKWMDWEQAISLPIWTNWGGSRKYIWKFQEVWKEIEQDVHPSLTKRIIQNRLWKKWDYNQAISIPKWQYR